MGFTPLAVICWIKVKPFSNCNCKISFTLSLWCFGKESADELSVKFNLPILWFANLTLKFTLTMSRRTLVNVSQSFVQSSVGSVPFKLHRNWHSELFSRGGDELLSP